MARRGGSRWPSLPGSVIKISVSVFFTVTATVDDIVIQGTAGIA